MMMKKHYYPYRLEGKRLEEDKDWIFVKIFFTIFHSDEFLSEKQYARHKVKLLVYVLY